MTEGGRVGGRDHCQFNELLFVIQNIWLRYKKCYFWSNQFGHLNQPLQKITEKYRKCHRNPSFILNQLPAKCSKEVFPIKKQEKHLLFSSFLFKLKPIFW